MKGNENSLFYSDNKLNQKNFFLGVEDQITKDYAIYKAPTKRIDKSLLKIPEPSIFKSDHPIKAIHVMENEILVGNDGGELIIIGKEDFKLIDTQILIEAPVMKIE